MFVGFFILALGLLFLLRNLGWIEGARWDLIWPLLIIAFGASMIFKRRK
jgi:hypothetical protein